MCSFNDKAGKEDRVTKTFHETQRRLTESHTSPMETEHQVKSKKTIDSPEYAELDGYEILRISDLLKKLIPEH
jgi:hypothetical protein